MPKEAWGNLKKIFATSTTVRKLQLRQELSNVRQKDMFVADYTTRIKDSSLFSRQGRNGPVSLLLYVDDLVITRSDLDEIDHVKSQLAASFDMKDLEDLHYFLGFEVIRIPEGILVSQQHHVLSMLFKFNMTECKFVSTPLDRNVKLHPESGTVCDP